MKLRLAAALLISDPPAAEINGLRRACSDGLLDRVDPHITLVEPINVREDDVDEVHRILRDASERGNRCQKADLEAGRQSPHAASLVVV